MSILCSSLTGSAWGQQERTEEDDVTFYPIQCFKISSGMPVWESILEEIQKFHNPVKAYIAGSSNAFLPFWLLHAFDLLVDCRKQRSWILLHWRIHQDPQIPLHFPGKGWMDFQLQQTPIISFSSWSIHSFSHRSDNGGCELLSDHLSEILVNNLCWKANSTEWNTWKRKIKKDGKKVGKAEN